MKISVVVVARNEASHIEHCMRSLAEQDFPAEDYEVILVDDGSTDATVELARGAVNDLRVISNPSRSISANRNRGWRSASHPFVAFIDADCIAPSHWLNALASGMEQTQADGVGGANVPPSNESLFYDALGIMLNTWLGSRGSTQGMVYAEPRRMKHLPGLNVLFRKDALIAVGGYDERFRLVGEDEDLSHRLNYEGFVEYYVPGATIVHRQRANFRRWARNMFTYGKGRTWLIRRHPQAFEIGLLIPAVLPLLLAAYLPVICLLSLWFCLRNRRPWLVLHVFSLFATTHLSYGIGQWYGLFTKGDNATTGKRRRKTGFVALKNAGNKGDEAILVSVTARQLKLRDQPTDSYLIALGPSGFDVRLLPGNIEGIERVVGNALRASDSSRSLRLGSWRFWNTALRFPLVAAGFESVVFCGGQWIHDLKPIFHAAICVMVCLAKCVRQRWGLFCVGSGPLRYDWSRWLTRYALGHGSLITVRDHGSYNLYRELGLNQVKMGADPALELPITAPSVGHAIASRTQPLIGVTPCAWFRFDNIYTRNSDVIERMVDEMSFVIQRMQAAGFCVKLIPTMNPEDEQTCLTLQQRSIHSDGIEILNTRCITPRQLQAEIGQLDLLISMRLHPIIFAFNTGTPFVALNYAPKVEHFCREIGMENQLVDLNDSAWARRTSELAELTLQQTTAFRDDMDVSRATLHARLAAAYDELWSWLARDPSNFPKSQEQNHEDLFSEPAVS